MNDCLLRLRPENPRMVDLTVGTDWLTRFTLATSRVRDLGACKYLKARELLQRAWRDAGGESYVEVLKRALQDRSYGAISITLPEDLNEIEYIKFFSGFCLNVIEPKIDQQTSSMLGERRSLHRPEQHLVSKADRMASPYYYETLHTDGPPAPLVRDEVVCISIARRDHGEAGESLFLHIDDWGDYQKFSNRSESRASWQVTLQKSATFAEAQRAEKAHEVQFQTEMFFTSRYGESFYFPSGYFQAKDAAQASYLSNVEESLNNAVQSGECCALSAPAGTIFAVNNYFWLHGRKPFEYNEKIARTLYRARGCCLPLENFNESLSDITNITFESNSERNQPPSFYCATASMEGSLE